MIELSMVLAAFAVTLYGLHGYLSDRRELRRLRREREALHPHGGDRR